MSAPHSAIPAQFAGLVALVEGFDNSDDAKRALIAARTVLHNALREDVFDRVHAFINTEAAHGPWKSLHAFIQGINERAHPWTAGDYHNAYAMPAIEIGMALAYVYLAEGGAK